jgi:hypothetical protein
MILKLNDEVYLCGTVYKTGKDYKYYQTSIDDINELDEYVKFFENEELQDILKTMTYMKDFKVYKLNEDRYLELGNIIKEEYNISCLSDNKKTDKENSVTPEDEIKIVNDYEEEKAIIFINKAKKISLDTNMKESFDGIVNKRFFESSTFNVYIQNNISCYGNIITEKNNDHEILFFIHLQRLYNSEYYENNENSFMEYRNVGELNGFFYTDDGIRFFHDICIDEEQGLYMSIMCYDPTGKEKNIDANKLYYSDNYQKMLNSIKIEDITKDDYNDYMKNLDKIVKEEVKKQ